jgi:hypothetical protein
MYDNERVKILPEEYSPDVNYPNPGEKLDVLYNGVTNQIKRSVLYPVIDETLLTLCEKNYV